MFGLFGGSKSESQIRQEILSEQKREEARNNWVDGIIRQVAGIDTCPHCKGTGQTKAKHPEKVKNLTIKIETK